MSSTASHKIQPTPRPPLRRGPTYQPPPSAPRPEPPLVTPSICATPTQPPRHRGPRRQRSLSTSLVTHHRRSSSLSRLMRSPASSSLASPPLESPSPSTVDAGTYFSNLTLETPRGPILPEVKLVQAAPLANASLQMLVLGGQPLRDVGLDEEIEYERMTALRKLKSSNDLSCSPAQGSIFSPRQFSAVSAGGRRLSKPRQVNLRKPLQPRSVNRQRLGRGEFKSLLVRSRSSAVDGLDGAGDPSVAGRRLRTTFRNAVLYFDDPDGDGPKQVDTPMKRFGQMRYLNREEENDEDWVTEGFEVAQGGWTGQELEREIGGRGDPADSGGRWRGEMVKARLRKKQMSRRSSGRA